MLDGLVSSLDEDLIEILLFLDVSAMKVLAINSSAYFDEVLLGGFINAVISSSVSAFFSPFAYVRSK